MIHDDRGLNVLSSSMRNITELNVGQLQPGSYLVRMLDGSGALLATERLVIAR
jgi:hypothetical protein